MKRTVLYLLVVLTLATQLVAAEQPGDVDRLVAAVLGDTPMVEDLRVLTDVIGGRPTGSAANRRSVDWAVDRLKAAGVKAWTESFPVPAVWQEVSVSARIRGDGVEFEPAVAAMPFSAAAEALSAPLVDGGAGTEEDLARLGGAAEDAFLLVESEPLQDISGLFAEYMSASEIERRAFSAGVAGVVYQGSRPGGVLHRHNASLGPDNRHPMLVMERDDAARALRLLRSGTALGLTVDLEVEIERPGKSHNVLAEIPGSADAGEIVVVGAHLDSWDLGTGALDNGCNVAMLIDLARQIERLGLRPRRTIRFALWNGEELGLHGSLGYVRRHRDELDRHVVAMSFDTGSGRITGFLTGGRPEIGAATGRALESVRGLGPFEMIDAGIYGTDHFDFMLEGVATLVADQASANYGPNYHARTDTFDRVDPTQLRLNAAVAAAVVWGFAEMDADWGRQDAQGVRALVEETDLGDMMRAFHVYEEWAAGKRGRR